MAGFSQKLVRFGPSFLGSKNDVRLQLSDKSHQPSLIHILVFLLGAGLWRWRVGWGQVRTARRLDPRAAVVEARVIRSGSQPLSNGGEIHR